MKKLSLILTLLTSLTVPIFSWASVAHSLNNLSNQDVAQSRPAIYQEILNKLSKNVYSQDDNVIKGTLIPTQTPNIVLEDCFPCKVKGMNVSEEENIRLSKVNGAVTQYVINPTQSEAEFDTVQLSKNISNVVDYLGDFFLKNPQYKGSFAILYSVIPVVNGKPQFDILDEKSKLLYAGAENHIQCDIYNELCSAEQTIPIGFSEAKDSKELMIKLKTYMSKNSLSQDDSNPVFIKNKNYGKPLNYLIFMGTNGYVTEKEVVDVFLTKLGIAKKE